MPTPFDHPTRRLHVEINGHAVVRDVECRKHLSDFLREDCGLKGTHLGCEHGVCGACTVRVDGHIVRGCLVLAAQADGQRIETVETESPSPRLRALQDAFIEHNALQCGYCTPGMLMAALDLVERRPGADRDAVRAWMSGNYCRCTGYQAIVDAVCTVLDRQRAGAFETTAERTAPSAPAMQPAALPAALAAALPAAKPAAA